MTTFLGMAAVCRFADEVRLSLVLSNNCWGISALIDALHVCVLGLRLCEVSLCRWSVYCLFSCGFLQIYSEINFCMFPLINKWKSVMSSCAAGLQISRRSWQCHYWRHFKKPDHYWVTRYRFAAKVQLGQTTPTPPKEHIIWARYLFLMDMFSFFLAYNNHIKKQLQRIITKLSSSLF